MVCSTDNKKIDKKLIPISKPNILDKYNDNKLNDEIHKEVHRHLSIFNSKINNTANHVFQIEENL